MKILTRHEFEDVTGWELGWSPIGRPMMTAYMFFVAGQLLIDTGMRHMRKEVLGLVAGHPIGRILLTHCHEDHSGNAGIISSQFGIPVYGNEVTAEKMKRPARIYPYQHLMWGQSDPVRVLPVGDLVTSDGLEIRPIYAPGHSRDHTVYYVPQRGWLFSGDLYLSEKIKYFRSDERIDWQIASLKKVLTLDFEALFCAHRPQPKNGKTHLRRKLQYLEDFYGAVSALAKSGMDEGMIMRRLKLKEQQLVKLMCFGNVSMKQMVRSVIRATAG